MIAEHFSHVKAMLPRLTKRTHQISKFNDLKSPQMIIFKSDRSQEYLEFISSLKDHNIPFEIENVVRDMQGIKNPNQIVNTTITYVIFI
jgi:hypothetical protein